MEASFQYHSSIIPVLHPTDASFNCSTVQPRTLTCPPIEIVNFQNKFKFYESQKGAEAQSDGLRGGGGTAILGSTSSGDGDLTLWDKNCMRVKTAGTFIYIVRYGGGGGGWEGRSC